MKASTHRVLLIALAATALPFIGGGWSQDDFVHIRRVADAGGIADFFTTKDPFGFYRPAAHITWFADALVWGFRPALWRLTNVAIHAGVVLLAFEVAALLMTRRAAWLAALTFVLTVKAPNVALFWPSARPELIMSLWSLAAVAGWVQWDRRRGTGWLVVSGASYVFAFLAKETAALLPVLLLFTPSSHALLTRRRLFAAAGILSLGAIPLALRMSVGALMPTSVDEHYGWVWTTHRWWRSLQVYLPRALPSAAGLVLLVAIPAAVATRPVASLRDALTNEATRRWASYALLWFLVFIAAALPIVGRSELYLYFPGFGFGLLAGYFTDRVLTSVNRPRFAAIALTCYVALFAGYQIARHIEAHRVMRFTGAVVQAMRQDEWLRAQHGRVIVVPDDATTEQLLKDGIWGYMPVVVRYALERDDIDAAVEYTDQPRQDPSLPRVRLAYDGAVVRFRKF